MSISPPVSAPAPAPQNTPGKWRLSPLALPYHALRLLVTCAVPLVIWFSVGHLGRYLLIWAGAEVSHGSFRQVRLALVILIFALMIMLQAIVTMGMLYILRGRLMETAARRAAGEGDESLMGAINRSILVYVILYLAWDFWIEDGKALLNFDFVRNLDIEEKAVLGGESEAGRAIIDLDFRLAIGIVVVAFVIRWLLMRLAERRDSGTTRIASFYFVFLIIPLIPFLELAYSFYGITSVEVLIDGQMSYLEGRAVYQWGADVVAAAQAGIPGWDAAWGLWGEIQPYVLEAVLLPLVWLTIGMLVFGAAASDTRWDFSRGRLQAKAQRIRDRSHTLTKKGAAKVTEGTFEKWQPLLNSFRLIVKAGLPLFGMFCLCFAAVNLGTSYFTRAIVGIFGSAEPTGWYVWLEPVFYVEKLLFTGLTLCLVAATFDLAATRLRRLRAGEQQLR